MVRAAQLASWPERQRLGTSLEALIALAEHRLCLSPRFVIRHAVVLEQRQALHELAARLRAPAPVNVAVLARLSQLIFDKSSPIYIGGPPPGGLADITAWCLQALHDQTNAEH
jgi:hypothetical protein